MGRRTEKQTRSLTRSEFYAMREDLSRFRGTLALKIIKKSSSLLLNPGERMGFTKRSISDHIRKDGRSDEGI